MKTTEKIQKVYDDNHVKISKIIKRSYNNPLGEDYLNKFISSLDDQSKKKHILDIGAGRGSGDIYIVTKSNSDIEGVELSEDMFLDARDAVQKEHLENKINLHHSNFMEFDFKDKKFDGIISLDVFCYFTELDKLFDKIKTVLKPGGILCFSEYHCNDLTNKKVKTLIKKWAIRKPKEFLWYKNYLIKNNFEIIDFQDTTNQYFLHWKEMEKRTIEKKSEIETQIGISQYNNFLSSIQSIINAVSEKTYGHLFCIAKHREIL